MIPKYVIIHTAAHQGDNSIDDVRRWHIERGFMDVGYHYYIRRDGEIQTGRQETHIGAHCQDMDMNYNSLGVCFEGHGDYEPLTQQQRNSLCDLYEGIVERWDIPVKDVLGHRETGAPKTCPGKKVDMDDLRNMLNLSSRFLPKRRGDEIAPVETKLPRPRLTKLPPEWVEPVSYSNTLADFKGALRKRLARKEKTRFFFNLAVTALSNRLGLPELKMLKLETNNLKVNTMAEEAKGWLEKKLEEKSTYIGAAITVAVLILGYFGLEISVAELTSSVESVIVAASALIVALSGLYELFRDEKTED